MGTPGPVGVWRPSHPSARAIADRTSRRRFFICGSFKECGVSPMDVSRKRLVAWRSSISTGAKIGGECSNPLRYSGWSVKYFLNEIDCLFLVDKLCADQGFVSGTP